MQRATVENDEETLGVLTYSLSLVQSAGNSPGALPLQKDTNALYSYKPLRPGTKDIRILILYPDHDPEAEIRCDLFPLEHEFMRENGVESFPYMALSYTWGNRDPPRFISLGGKQKQVTLNLYRALLEFRDPTMPSLLWVDALCINQDSIDEKNHQVNMMDDVYKNAGCVLIWLDEE
ncbi:HET-domain-containing protein, partial [Trichoderma citrinoviride]